MSARFEQGLQIGYAALGHNELAVTTGAVETLPNLPAGDRLRRAVIRPRDFGVVFTDDGTDPTEAHGMPIDKDEIVVFDGDFHNFKLIAVGGTADVRIAYYGL